MVRPLPGRIETPRLTLRPATPADRDDVVAGIGNLEVSRWLAVVPYPYGPADFDAWLGSDDAAPGRTWMMDLGGRVLGAVGLGGHLGYWLKRPAWGRGIATEAVSAVLDARFHRARSPVIATVFDGNERSAALARRLGFVAADRVVRSSRALSQEVTATEYVLTRDRWRARAPATRSA